MTKIGIDPDVEKSGVAEWDGSKLTLHAMTLIELFYFLSENKMNDIQVYIECGWLIKKTNWKKGKRIFGGRTHGGFQMVFGQSMGKRQLDQTKFHCFKCSESIQSNRKRIKIQSRWKIK